ncbi:hypothetical protein CSOJ01_11331 [Colletotrichum sojae]|uniref:Uncharacterized protein n=1 Tax=Colletotrichum sojae TaxID=2175907 RepID=A0A8H6IXQ2_9PEZI|nr:hypothetical protein CSOJ01_11331 [Colletotrichum sojae]
MIAATHMDRARRMDYPAAAVSLFGYRSPAAPSGDRRRKTAVPGCKFANPNSYAYRCDSSPPPLVLGAHTRGLGRLLWLQPAVLDPAQEAQKRDQNITFHLDNDITEQQLCRRHTIRRPLDRGRGIGGC